MAGQTFHFGVITGVRQAEMHEGVLPEIGPDEILLKMEMCNICTTDYQRFSGLRECDFPMADGHEYTGIIVKKGENVIDAYQIGDRVGKLNRYCGDCEDCRSGRTSYCQFTGGFGIGPDGYYGMKGYADYMIIPQRLALKVANDIPAAEAAFLEPVATAVHCIKKGRIAPMENVVVIGVGTMGIVNAQVAKAFGARVIMSDISEKKVERARSMNIGTVINAKETDPVEEVKRLTHGVGAETVIVSVGNTIAYKQAYQMIRQFGGKILFFPAGFPKPEFDLDPNDLHYRRAELIGTVDADNVDFMEAARLLSERLVDISYALEGKTFPLREYQAALEAANIPDSYRVSVDLQGI